MIGLWSVLVTRWVIDPDGTLRLHLAPADPARPVHTHVSADDGLRLVAQWGPGHNVIPFLPSDALCECPEVIADA